jgi:hypothetical protein
MIQEPEFKEKSRLKPYYFTRNRKLPFKSLITMMLNMMRRTLQLEIDEFMESMQVNENKISYTKQSLSEARQKLSPDAFKILNDRLVSDFYSDDDYRKYKGYRLLSLDASILEIPNNLETKNEYGYAKNGYGCEIARAMSSNLYDIENNIIVSSKIDKYKSCERTLAKENIETLLSYGHNHIKNLILFDRGYPSLDFILYLLEKDISFLMRAYQPSLSEINNAGIDEEIIIKIDQSRHKKLKENGINIDVGKSFKIRVIRVKLQTGEEEILITNLFSDILSSEEAKELYFRRWGIETKFDDLKNKLEIENFSGEKPLIIEQDYYASVFISNIAGLIRLNAEEERKSDISTKHLKYEYKINNNILIGKLKNKLMWLLLEENDTRRELMYNDFLQEVQRNVVPIRKNRQFNRNKSLRSNKFPKNKRRCL